MIKLIKMKKLLIPIVLLLFSIAGNIFGQTLQTELEEYYTFDELEGQLINVANPGINNSSNVAATYNVEGKIGTAFSFNTCYEYVTFNDHENWTISTSSDLSVSAWIYLTGDYTYNDWECIWGHQNGPQLYLLNISSGNYKIGWYAGTSDTQTGTMSFAFNTWYHIVLVKNGSTVKLYRNNIDLGTYTVNDNNINPPLVYIGGDTYREALIGKIDELGIWKRALTSDEVNQLYNSGNGLPYESFSGSPTVPTAPSGLTATAASCSQINLSWTDNSDDETGFYVYRGGTQIASVSSNTTTYSNTGLSGSTPYSYYIVAYNGSGNSSNSNTANATTPTCSTVPSAPSGLSATAASCSQINLSWTDNSNDETGFRIYRGGTQIASVEANITSYNNTGLDELTSYSYYIVSYNSAGNSSNSNTATATTTECSSGSTVWLNNGDNIYYTSGNVGIGTDNPKAELSVDGTILSNEVKVQLDISAYPDFVFDDDYYQLTLEELEKFINENDHLPEIPTAKETEENGMSLGAMNAKLLQKIEELTLYIIELKKENEQIKAQYQQMQQEINELKNQIK